MSRQARYAEQEPRTATPVAADSLIRRHLLFSPLSGGALFLRYTCAYGIEVLPCRPSELLRRLAEADVADRRDRLPARLRVDGTAIADDRADKV